MKIELSKGKVKVTILKSEQLQLRRVGDLLSMMADHLHDGSVRSAEKCLQKVIDEYCKETAGEDEPKEEAPEETEETEAQDE